MGSVDAFNALHTVAKRWICTADCRSRPTYAFPVPFFTSTILLRYFDSHDKSKQRNPDKRYTGKIGRNLCLHRFVDSKPSSSVGRRLPPSPSPSSAAAATGRGPVTDGRQSLWRKEMRDRSRKCRAGLPPVRRGCAQAASQTEASTAMGLGTSSSCCSPPPTAHQVINEHRTDFHRFRLIHIGNRAIQGCKGVIYAVMSSSILEVLRLNHELSEKYEVTFGEVLDQKPNGVRFLLHYASN